MHHGVPSRRQQMFEIERRKLMEEETQQRQNRNPFGILPPPPPPSYASAGVAAVGYSSLKISTNKGTFEQRRLNIQYPNDLEERFESTHTSEDDQNKYKNISMLQDDPTETKFADQPQTQFHDQQLQPPPPPPPPS